MGGFAFHERLQIGERYEKELDSWATDSFDVGVKKVSMELQQLGIDRIWEKPDGSRASVEYKADLKAHRTGNVFLELQAAKNKPGWVYYSIAQYLLYYIPGLERVYLVDMVNFKRKVKGWISGKRLREVRNEYSSAAGVPYPIRDFAADTGAKAFQVAT